MNDEQEVCVVEVESIDSGTVEIFCPRRIRIGTRTVGELREYGIDPDKFERKNIRRARTFPEETLKVMSWKELKNFVER